MRGDGAAVGHPPDGPPARSPAAARVPQGAPPHTLTPSHPHTLTTPDSRHLFSSLFTRIFTITHTHPHYLTILTPSLYQTVVTYFCSLAFYHRTHPHYLTPSPSSPPHTLTTPSHLFTRIYTVTHTSPPHTLTTTDSHSHFPLCSLTFIIPSPPHPITLSSPPHPTPHHLTPSFIPSHPHPSHPHPLTGHGATRLGPHTAQRAAAALPSGRHHPCPRHGRKPVLGRREDHHHHMQVGGAGTCKWAGLLHNNGRRLVGHGHMIRLE